MKLLSIGLKAKWELNQLSYAVYIKYIELCSCISWICCRMPFVDFLSRVGLYVSLTCSGLSCLWSGKNRYRLRSMTVGFGFLENRLNLFRVFGTAYGTLFSFQQKKCGVCKICFLLWDRRENIAVKFKIIS